MAFTSIRAKVAQLFGFGKKPKTVIPKTRAQAYYRSYEGGVKGNLVRAIETKQPVTFFYKDKWQPEGTPGALGQRVGNPHAIWRGTNGRTYLHLYVDPQSATATGDLPGWRTFLVNRIQGVSVLELGSSFFGRPVRFVTAPGWNPSWYSRVGQPIKLLE
tara:strand:+ start:178 stop:654 length:477 start_codon:yes stop_codon:yes gene_type:complete